MAAPSKGRPPLEITDAARALVREMAQRGDDRSRIALAVGVSLPTLRKYFAEDLAMPGSAAQTPAASLFDAAPDALPPPREVAPAAPRPGAGGRKPHAPTLESREKVRLLIAVNTREADIAIALGITEPTLRKHYKADLATGAVRQKAETLMALNRAARKGNVAAQKALIEMLERGTLERLEDSMRGAPGYKPEAKPRQPETLGKKATDAQSALDVAESPEWRDLLRPPGLNEKTGLLPN